jgi:predicted transposase/invertase (TIGR01784 family)
MLDEITQKFFTCKYDRAFKELFLNEENKYLLKALLEKILNVEIKQIDIRNNERNSGNLHIRRKYLDCLLKTNIGIIGIEINSEANREYVPLRNFAYFCDMYSSSVKLGEEYDKKIQYVQINFNYNIPEYKHEDCIDVYFMQTDKQKKFIDNVRIISLDMEMYKKKWLNKDERAIEDNKLFIMLDLEKEDLALLSKNDRMVKDYMEKLDTLNQDLKFRQYLTEDQDLRMIYNTEVKEAKKEGYEQSKIEIAKESLLIGLDIDTISKITKLSKEEVEALAK